MSRLTITHSKIASLLAVFGCRWAKCVPDFAEDAGGKPGWLSGHACDGYRVLGRQRDYQWRTRPTSTCTKSELR